MGAKVKQLAGTLSFDSPSSAKTAANKLHNQFQNADSKAEKKRIRTATKKAAKRADNKTVAKMYRAAARRMKILSSPSSSSKRSFKSDWNAFVSQEMKNYSQEDIRSGRAMKEIAKKWNKKKKGSERDTNFSAQVLDLFAGRGGFSQSFQNDDRYNVITVDDGTDIDPKEEGVDIKADIMDLDPDDLPDDIDIVLASPPCKTFSRVNSSKRHYSKKQGKPLSNEAKEAAKIVDKTVDLIEEVDPEFYFIENPVGHLKRYMATFHDMEPVTIDQCAYGREFLKPTHLFGRFPDGFEPERCSHPNDYNHPSLVDETSEAAERSELPVGLSKAIKQAVEMEN